MCLRDQGVSYQAYISQISYLLFLKMDEERVNQIGEASMLPAGFRWGDIKDMTGEAAGRRLWQAARKALAAGWRHRHDLPQGAERNSGSRQAQAGSSA